MTLKANCILCNVSIEIRRVTEHVCLICRVLFFVRQSVRFEKIVDDLQSIEGISVSLRHGPRNISDISFLNRQGQGRESGQQMREANFPYNPA